MNELLIATQKTSAVEVDPYYNLVSLHLKGDVNTGRSYNAFSDASSNNFRLTNNGDVRGSSFSPYGTSWSGFFDGTGDFVTTSSSSALALSTGDFTAECWIYPVSIPNWGGIYSSDPVTGNAGFAFGFRNTGDGQVQVKLGNDASQDAFYSTSNVRLQTWSHLAVVRSGSGANNVTLYINGVAAGSMTSNRDVTHTIAVLGRWYTTSDNFYLNGYLSNFRLIKGQALFTGNFTPTTSALTSSSVGHTGTGVAASLTGTVSLLTCQSNRFIDSTAPNAAKSGGLTLTPSGETRISSFSPFLDSDTTSGSGYFDGNGDWLTIAEATPLQLNAVAFSIELWVYPATVSSNKMFIGKRDTSGGTGYAFSWYIQGNASGGFTFYSASGSLSSNNNVLIANAWNHIAVTSDGTNVSMFANGNRVNTPTALAVGNSASSIYIGNFPVDNLYYQGNIADVRIQKGAQTYSGTQYTVPTSLLTRDASTALLTLQERGAYNTVGFQDESEYQHVITRPSGANVAQGTFSPFSNSGWSNLFNGSSGYISALGDAGFAFGTDDFTIEMWVNITGTNAGLICHGPVATAGSWMLEIGGSTFSWQAAMNANLIQVSASSVLGTGWKHVAVTRASGTTRLFVDGGLLGSSSAASNFNTTTGPLWIGRSYNNAYTAGHISNVRVIKSQALYTGAFTPPANQLTATSVGTTGANVAASLTGTVSLLTCQSNRFLDQTGKTITVNGSPSVAAFSPFKPPAYDPQVHGGSGYFDRAGDFLSLATNNNFDFGTGNFTVELFYYPLAYDDIQMFFSGTSNYQFGYSATDSRNLYYYGSGGNVISGTPASSMVLNQWNHIVLVRSGTSLAIMSNGVRQGTATHSSSVNFSGSPIVGGYADNTAFYAIRGYMSGFRAVKGVAVYDPTQTTYTVPTAPLPLLGNTSLLLNFTNGGVIDSTGKNVLETVGNAGVVTTAIKKYGSGSLFFDGTGDYLNGFNDSGALFLGTSYTIEFWLRLNSVSGNQNLICLSAANNSNQGINSYTTGTSITIDDGNTASTGPSGGTLAINTWYHVALVANGTNTKLFIDGTLISTYGGITRYTAGGAWKYITVGANGSKTSNYLNGYIDDLRITNGLARYIGSGAVGTTYFTAPSKALSDRGTLSTLTSDLAAPSSVEALVVAGGGGGGGDYGGGGGAGGFRELVGGNAIAVSAGTDYTITVGGGGSGGGSSRPSTGSSGGNSYISGSGITNNPSSGNPYTNALVAYGGGYGIGYRVSEVIAGGSGGSGGGGGSRGGAVNSGGSGNTPSTSPSQGSNGGNGSTATDGGGGGGASAAGGNASAYTSGSGGAGSSSSISGSSVTYAGGGGGAPWSGDTAGSGGSGGGGAGNRTGTGNAGTANTGGGGGGGAGSPISAGGNGGSGVVILAYPTTFKPLKASLGLVYTIDTVTRPGYRVYKFVAGTGTISW